MACPRQMATIGGAARARTSHGQGVEQVHGCERSKRVPLDISLEYSKKKKIEMIKKKKKSILLTDRVRMELAQRRRRRRRLPTSHNRPGLLPNLPKAQHLTTSRNNSGTLGVLGEMEDTFGVASKVGDFLHGGVTPDGDLVLRKTVAAHQLLGVLAPLKGADLGLSIHAVQTLPGRNIPKTNASIRSTTSRGQEVPLPRAPSNSFHRGSVEGKVVQGGGRRRERREGGGRRRRGGVGGQILSIPDHQLVIVGTRSKMTTIGGPLETTDLLFVTTEGGGVVEGSEVVVDDHRISSSGGKGGSVPGEGGDTGHVVTFVTDLWEGKVSERVKKKKKKKKRGKRIKVKRTNFCLATSQT